MESTELIAAAKAAAKRKNWDEAAALWKQANFQNVKNAIPENLISYARSLRMAGRLHEASVVIDETIASHKTNRGVFEEAAEIASALLDWSTAVDHWAMFFELSKKSGKNIRSKAFVRQALALKNNDDLDAAIQILSIAKKQYSDDVGVLNAHEAIEAQKIVRERQGNIVPEGEISLDDLNVRNVCECFWEVERKLDLINWSVNGVHVWPLIRMQVYYALTQDIGLYDAPHPSAKTQKNTIENNSLTLTAMNRAMEMPCNDDESTNLVKTWAPIVRSLLQNPIRTAKTYAKAAVHKTKTIKRMKTNGDDSYLIGKDSAVLMATRKLRGSEPYTAALRKELGDQTILLDRPFGDPIIDNAINFDTLVKDFRVRYRKLPLEVIRARDRIICEEILEMFRVRLNYRVPNLVGRIQSTISTFAAVREGFFRLWSAYPITNLYLTNAYGITTRAAMVAAQDLGINCVEFQHGFISEFHLGYSWPGRPTVPYVPNELWCFGDYWYLDATPLASNVQGRTIGAPYVDQMANIKETERAVDTVVFTSQGVVGRRLIEWAVETAKLRPDKNIIYRLHPSETLEDYNYIEEKFSGLPANFSLSHKDPNIFKLLAGVAIQVGAFSTTLLEGIALGTRAIVVDLPGVEYMQPIIKRGDALFVRNVEELAARLDEAPVANSPHYYYAPPLERLVR